jgi:hypothetical protein
MNTLSFSRELVDGVVKYLASRPYAEVAGILERMNQEAAPQLKPAPAPEVSDAAQESKEVAS